MKSSGLGQRMKQRFALAMLRLCGWKLTGERPSHPRFIVLGVPHTSQWDFFFIFLVAWGNGVDFRWVGKKDLFRFPLGGFFRFMGGIPIDRSRSTNMVDSLVALFEEHESLIILIAPEGTRKRVSQWKTGFYQVASGAGIPFVPGYMDYRKKEAGIGAPVFPTGDYEADLLPVYRFYDGISACNPDQYESPLVALAAAEQERRALANEELQRG